jgi:hypothetical protein
MIKKCEREPQKPLRLNKLPIRPLTAGLAHFIMRLKDVKENQKKHYA